MYVLPTVKRLCLVTLGTVVLIFVTLVVDLHSVDRIRPLKHVDWETYVAGPPGSETIAYRKLQQRTEGPSHTWWPYDPQCARFDVRYGWNLTMMLLQSYPRSGNTWTRYLLEAATGIFTSSVYKDFSLIRAGYLGERSKIWYHNTIATKVHFVKHLWKFKTVPAIVIIRNPARVLVSLWSYKNVKKRRRKHIAVVDTASFNTSEFHAFVPGALTKWLLTTRVSLEQTKRRLLLLYYEEMRENPMREVRKMLRFLRVEPDEERLTCLERHLEGKVKSGQRSLNPYRREEREEILKAVEEVKVLLAKRGFPPLPDYSKYNS